MPWEHIGDCGNGQMPHERDWMICQLEMGIRYLQCVCGGPPEGYEVAIMWHEHGSVDYPTIGVCWGEDDSVFLGAPWEYIEKCRLALEAFDEAIHWREINPLDVKQRIDDQVAAREDADESSGER
jgi:hypothetical protein